MRHYNYVCNFYGKRGATRDNSCSAYNPTERYEFLNYDDALGCFLTNYRDFYKADLTDSNGWDILDFTNHIKE